MVIFFLSMHTQNLIKTKSSLSLPLKSMKKNGKEMGDALRLNSLFGVLISWDISLLFSQFFWKDKFEKSALLLPGFSS